MSNIPWDEIIEEAEKLESRFLRQDGGLSEAEKAGDFFISNQYNEDKMARYLKILATNPPKRSKKSEGYYRNMRNIWQSWQTDLKEKNKARAWGWGIRLAKSQIVLRTEIP
jgi:hypothetical protein